MMDGNRWKREASFACAIRAEDAGLTIRLLVTGQAHRYVVFQQEVTATHPLNVGFELIQAMILDSLRKPPAKARNEPALGCLQSFSAQISH